MIDYLLITYCQYLVQRKTLHFFLCFLYIQVITLAYNTVIKYYQVNKKNVENVFFLSVVNFYETFYMQIFVMRNQCVMQIFILLCVLKRLECVEIFLTSFLATYVLWWTY